MSEKQRPTSPHLQIYKWNVSSLTSIGHRLTGVLLYFSILVISWYVTYYAYRLGTSPVLEQSEHCDCLMTKILYGAFSIAVVFVTFALYYHFLNGIRHLCWDFGKGFEKNFAKKTGRIVIGLALFLTIITIILVTQNFGAETVEIIIQ